MNILELINYWSSRLKIESIPSHKLDSEILLSKVLGINREQVLINLDKKIKTENIIKFNKLIKRRSSKEPVAYLLQEKEFWSKKFEINRYTLIPRPETELLVEQLVHIFKSKSINILDIGTGSGCILISLLSELKNSFGHGLEVSKNAVLTAQNNANIHGLRNKLKLHTRSFTKFYGKKFDLIVSNPPYIEKFLMKNLKDDIKKFEPKIALEGGIDGLDVIKKVIYKAKEILKINGVLALEIGNKQHLKVSKILTKNNFRITKYIKDYKDNIRCIISTLKN